jgi:hypothetical protein
MKTHKAEIIKALSALDAHGMAQATASVKRLGDYQHGRWALDERIRCFDCEYFKTLEEHGRGAGHCKAGKQGSGGSGLWWHSDCHEYALFELLFKR